MKSKAIKWMGATCIVLAGFVLMVLLMNTLGCSTMKADLAKVETKIKAIDWSDAVTYWKDFVKFADEGAPIVCAIFKNDTGTVGKIVGAVNAADSAVSTLQSTVASYKAGTLTEADVISAADATKQNVVAAVNLVASIKSGTTPVTTSPVPTN